MAEDTTSCTLTVAAVSLLDGLKHRAELGLKMLLLVPRDVKEVNGSCVVVLLSTDPELLVFWRLLRCASVDGQRLVRPGDQ